MAEGKNSFILYCDLLHTIELLPDDKAGKLFKHILEYVNDKNPETDDILIRLAFEPIKLQLKRDLQLWQETRKDRSDAGKIGGLKSGESRRSKQTKQVLQNRSKTKQSQANEAVTVNVTVTDTVTDKRGGNTPPQFSNQVIYNAEETILKNQIEFEKICAGAGISYEMGKEALHKYHLHLEEKEQYPKGKRAVFAGFEKWMTNEKKFLKNGTYKQPAAPIVKLGTSDERIEALRKW